MARQQATATSWAPNCITTKLFPSNFQSGIGENRTHIARIKSPMHYLVCHNPMSRLCTSNSAFTYQTSKVVAPRIELSATRVSDGFGQPALDYRGLKFQIEASGFPAVSSLNPDVYSQAGWEALESSSTVLQTAARPSQLPAQIGFVMGLPVRYEHEKRLGVCDDTEPS